MPCSMPPALPGFWEALTAPRGPALWLIGIGFPLLLLSLFLVGLPRLSKYLRRPLFGQTRRLLLWRAGFSACCTIGGAILFSLAMFWFDGLNGWPRGQWLPGCSVEPFLAQREASIHTALVRESFFGVSIVLELADWVLLLLNLYRMHQVVAATQNGYICSGSFAYRHSNAGLLKSGLMSIYAVGSWMKSPSREERQTTPNLIALAHLILAGCQKNLEREAEGLSHHAGTASALSLPGFWAR